MTLKLFPFDKIPTKVVDLIIQGNKYSTLVGRLLKLDIEIPEELCDKILAHINTGDESYHRESNMEYVLERADIHIAEKRDGRLPTKFIDGIIKSPALSMRLKYMATKLYLDYNMPFSPIIQTFIEEHIYDLMHHIISHWTDDVAREYMSDPRLVPYINELDGSLQEELDRAFYW